MNTESRQVGAPAVMADPALSNHAWTWDSQGPNHTPEERTHERRWLGTHEAAEHCKNRRALARQNRQGE